MTAMELNARRVSLASEILNTDNAMLLSEISEVVEKFRASLATTAEASKAEALNGIREAMTELKEHKAGRLKLQPFSELISELKQAEA